MKTLNELSSDHLPILITLSGHTSKLTPRISLNYREANWEGFQDHISENLIPTHIHNEQDIETAVTHITTVIQNAITNNIPHHEPRRHSNSLPPHIIQLIKQRNNTRRIWQRHHDNRNLKTQMNQLQERIHQAIQTHITDTWDYTLSGLDTTNMNQVWNITKRIRNTHTHTTTTSRNKQWPGHYPTRKNVGICRHTQTHLSTKPYIKQHLHCTHGQLS